LFNQCSTADCYTGNCDGDGACGYYTSGQNGCPDGYECDTFGNCFDICPTQHINNGDGTCTGTWQVTASSDDIERRISSGGSQTGFSLTSGNPIGSWYSPQEYQQTGLRFTNVNIPNSAAINVAYLTFRAHDTRTTMNAYTEIAAELSDNPATFANDGAAYDTVLFSVDPSATSATDIVYIPDEEMLFESGDEIDVAYPNNAGHAGTFGLRIVTTVV